MDHSVRKLTPYRVISIALLIILALMMLFPLYWIVTGSVKEKTDIIIKAHARSLPHQPDAG